MRPGIMVFPVASMRWAPAGAFTEGPTASILPLRITRVAFCMAGLPVPSIMRAPTKAITPPEPASGAAQPGASPRQAANNTPALTPAQSQYLFFIEILRGQTPPAAAGAHARGAGRKDFRTSQF